MSMCPACGSADRGMAVSQGRSVCAGCVSICWCICLCVCVSATAVYPCAHRLCPVCVFALSVLVYSCVPMSVSVCLLPRLCVCARVVSRSSSACPAGSRSCHLHLVPVGLSARPPREGRDAEGRERERRGVSTSPPTPARSPHSLSPGIEPYLESRFDICFQI